MRPPHEDAVRGLLAACRTSEITALRAALHEDAVAVCDGGGTVRGGEDVAGLVLVLLCRPGTVLSLESVNGRAGLASRRAGHAEAVVAAESIGAFVSALWIVVDPAKLTRWHVPAEHG
ncbi:siderophore-interacting protein [Actinoplanes sp. NPDC048988]|uniref:siderophore-interacting protein n=1 Tax=Actinoplanes sp. NPDC048988 TaxID=3363901 RepID=UPI0037103DB7